MLPEYTDETLPLALRRVDVVVDVCPPSSSLSLVLSPEGVPTDCSSDFSCRSRLGGGGMVAAGVSGGALGAEGLADSSGSADRMCCNEDMIAAVSAYR